MFRKTLAIIAVAVACNINAQSTATWTSSFEQQVNWQKVTSLGNYIVQTNAGLFGIDTETGNILWL